MPRNELLRQQRIRHNWRQKDVANQLDVSLLTVQRWELGVQQPSSYYRTKLCDLFGCSAEALGLEFADPAPNPSEGSSIMPASSEQIPRKESAFWTVPYLRNPYFTGREEFFRLLDEHLTPARQDKHSTTRRMTLTQPLALTGLGGIGKTQLAVEYAYRAREQGQYTHTFWINASSQEAIMASFTALAHLLPECGAKEETDQQKLVAAIKQWLEECPEHWLLLFDNADDLSLLSAYIPRSGNGSLLLTTRAQAVGFLATAIEVEKMDLLEGTQLLLRRAQRSAQASEEEIYAARKLVMALDYLPLALDQAGAYIEETGCTIKHYLQLYQHQRSTLLARRGAQASNYPDSLVATWSLSFERLHSANPATTQLLQLCAFLSPDHIPEELLREGAACWPEGLQQAVTDPLAFEEVLAALRRFSLVKRLAVEQQLSLHRLVQVVQMEMLSLQEQQQWAERVVRAVNLLFPRQPRDEVSSWPQCLRYLEQVQACAQLIQQYQLRLVEAADLLDRAGIYLVFAHASYSQAEALHLQALRLREELLGAQHPETASSLQNLGRLYGHQGKYEQAAPYFHRALAICEEQLGAQHPQMSAILNNLGMLYLLQGQYEQAEAYLRRALAIREEQVEAQHIETARILDSLGLLSYEQGKYEQAEAYYQQALAICEEQVEAQHPDRFNVLANLGSLYRQQGQYEQAEAYLRRALAIGEEQVGAQHPVMAEVLTDLAEWYLDQHYYEQAKPLFVRALVIQEQTLTANHPERARTLHSLARFYEAQGSLQAAVDLYQRALIIREQVYGPQHPKTNETRQCLQIVQHLLETQEDEGSHLK